MKNYALIRKIILILSVIPILIGVAVFIGWTVDAPYLINIFRNQITMKANTASGMILCGGSIVFLTYKLQNSLYRYVTIFISLVVLIVATLTLLQYIFQFNLRIDEFLVKDKISAFNIGRMSPTTAFLFLNISICILLAASPPTLRLRKPIIGALSVTVLIIASVIFLSYLPNMLWGYQILKSTYMSIHTAFSFMLLSAALFLLIYREENFIWSLNPFITYISVIGFILIILAADTYHNMTSQIRKNDEMILQIQQFQNKLNLIAVNLIDLENIEYHFLITKDKLLLLKIIENKNKIKNILEKADANVPNTMAQQSLMNELKYWVKKSIDLNNSAIQSPQNFSEKSFDVIEDFKLINKMSSLLYQLQKEINNLFISYVRTQKTSITEKFLISPLSTFSLIVLLSIGIAILNTNMYSRKKIYIMHRKLAEIVDSSNDAIISKNLNGIVTSWNKGAEQIFGYTATEMIDKPISILFPFDRINEEADILKRIAKGEKIEHFETIRKRKDGKPINVSVTISPLKNDKNEIIGASKIVRDITENKRLEQQLRQSNKMGAIGQLAGGIAHDFNNLLAIIIGNLDLLARSASENESIIKRINTALKAATRGADLTKRLLAFSRQQSLISKPVNLNESVNNLIEMATQILGSNIEITTELNFSLPLVLVDVSELESALLNLIVNARDAMPNGGKLLIFTQLRELDNKYPSVQTKEIPRGIYAAVSVTDTGHGIPSEILEHVYEPFFTTKERGKGTGMGLSMVYGFAKQSGGTVKIYSEVHHGTTVTIYLPLADVSSLSDQPIIESQKMLATYKVLVVDDEPDLLEIASLYFKEMGYEVYQATNGRDALEIFNRIPEISMLLTDIIMPGGINGIELANKIRKLKPDIIVIYVSGFPLGILTENESTKMELNSHFLSKPYQHEEFINAIKSIVYHDN